MVEKIKNVVVELIHHSEQKPGIKFSYFLSRKLNHSYTYPGNLFSEVKGMTIQQFILLHKIERVKELMVYDELTISEVAWKLHYSSVAHMSNQFKKITGFTPTYFKSLSYQNLIPLDDL